jgi:hypothetical protein
MDLGVKAGLGHPVADLVGAGIVRGPRAGVEAGPFRVGPGEDHLSGGSEHPGRLSEEGYRAIEVVDRLKAGQHLEGTLGEGEVL